MYSITRGAKIKSRGQITAMAEHNFRLRTQANIVKERTHLNRCLINRLGLGFKKSDELAEKLEKHYENLGAKKRKDSVLMLEFIATASPEFFEGKTAEYIDKWVDHQKKFFEKEFGDNLKLAVLHLDEKTPHIHFAISTENRKRAIYKNRHGQTEKEIVILDAKRWNPSFFKEFQTRFAENNVKFGLKRGNSGSKKVHTSPGEKIQSLEIKNKKLRDQILDFKPKIGATKKVLIELLTDMEKAIDILLTKDLNETEQVEVGKMARRYKKPKASPEM